MGVLRHRRLKLPAEELPFERLHTLGRHTFLPRRSRRGRGRKRGASARERLHAPRRRRLGVNGHRHDPQPHGRQRQDLLRLLLQATQEAGMRPRTAALTSLLLLAALAAADRRTPAEKSAPRPDEAKAAATSPPKALRLAVEKVGPLHKKMGPPQPGDWLDTFPEPGQTFEESLRGTPTRPEGERRVLYVQPLGRFTPAQTRVVALAAEFMSRFFGLAVRVRDQTQLDKVPPSARRISLWGDKQIQAGHIMMNVLRPTLPEGGPALIAFSSSALFPDETLNFVFGQASLERRV